MALAPLFSSGQVEVLHLCQFLLAATVTTLIRRTYLSLHSNPQVRKERKALRLAGVALRLHFN